MPRLQCTPPKLCTPKLCTPPKLSFGAFGSLPACVQVIFQISPPQAILLPVYTCVRVHMNVCVKSSFRPYLLKPSYWLCVCVSLCVCACTCSWMFVLSHLSDLTSSSHPIDCMCVHVHMNACVKSSFRYHLLKLSYWLYQCMCVHVHMNACVKSSFRYHLLKLSYWLYQCMCVHVHMNACVNLFWLCFGSLLCNGLYAPIWSKGVLFFFFF